MKTWLFTVGLLAAIPAFAQHAHQEAPRAGQALQPQQTNSPYAGMQVRAIKALSDQQLADLRAGKGMSLALPAELNGYPGPSHTLEFAAPLGLTAEQKQKTQQLFAQMQSEAKALGEELISREYDLDRLFKEHKVNAATLDEAIAKAAKVQGQLRASHLQYHLKMAEVLTPTQIAKYNELRGYQ
ncbi:MAG: hypothetical protein V7642_2858 [Burkholderiales bacterium]|jgi:Spy/CpxP family protein refolding chaperone